MAEHLELGRALEACLPDLDEMQTASETRAGAALNALWAHLAQSGSLPLLAVLDQRCVAVETVNELAVWDRDEEREHHAQVNS